MNLEFVENHKRHTGPFEVTQLLNSFLAVIAHPWDALLEKKELSKVRVSSTEFHVFGFPELTRIREPVNQIAIPNLYEYLRTIRNGMAHGNFELLDRSQLRDLAIGVAIPNVKEREIAGAKLWNVTDRDTPTERINWCVVVTIREMKAVLYAMQRLCECEDYWRPDVREAHQRKRTARLEARVG